GSGGLLILAKTLPLSHLAQQFIKPTLALPLRLKGNSRVVFNRLSIPHRSLRRRNRLTRNPSVERIGSRCHLPLLRLERQGREVLTIPSLPPHTVSPDEDTPRVKRNLCHHAASLKPTRIPANSARTRPISGAHVGSSNSRRHTLTPGYHGATSPR